MKRILGLILLFCAVTLFAANPSLYIPWTAARGAGGGVTVSTNPASGTITITVPADVWTNSNATISNSVASTVSNMVFSSSVAMTSGNLLEIRNAGLPVLQNSSRGGLMLFRNTPAYWGPLGPGDVIVSSFDPTLGDAAQANWFQGVANGSIEGNWQLNVRSNKVTMTLSAFVPNNQVMFFNIETNNTFFKIQSDSVVRTEINPTSSDSIPSYFFDTQKAHTSGPLLNQLNFGISHFQVLNTNGIATPQITAYGGTSQPWQFGSVVSNATVTANLTNYVEVSINGALYKLLIANP